MRACIWKDPSPPLPASVLPSCRSRSRQVPVHPPAPSVSRALCGVPAWPSCGTMGSKGHSHPSPPALRRWSCSKGLSWSTVLTSDSNSPCSWEPRLGITWGRRWPEVQRGPSYPRRMSRDPSPPGCVSHAVRGVREGRGPGCGESVEEGDWAEACFPEGVFRASRDQDPTSASPTPSLCTWDPCLSFLGAGGLASYPSPGGSPFLGGGLPLGGVRPELAAPLQRHYAQYHGFVVIHGTDTMAFAASVLSFVLENLQKTVILTGAQVVSRAGWAQGPS